ncbi:MAG: hypothetical protein WC214_04810 [Candidatus Omnitrophota bacterium]|nr:hypothetical protein [Candidatus Omnitrophota bacterium]
MSFRATVICLMLMFFPVFSFCEVVILRSGDIFKGELLEDTQDHIKMDVDGNITTYYWNDIQAVGPDDQYYINIEDRVWHMGYFASNDKTVLAEYVLDGETVEAWSELFTIMEDRISGITPRSFAEGFPGELIKKYPGLEWKIFDEGDNWVFMEWANHAEPYQHELRKIIRLGGVLMNISYVKKIERLSSEERERWINIINKSMPNSKLE